ncbi:MAG: polyprenol monophosphomannose synthase [Candidatus Kapabacteria bacterium]|nr:polyprenol monophosphomannose synthase [Candidatus Kapabacteria bacterium]MDW8012408.1 polyprenol monophosphomannose synthase [Bacteroidota bacterium]
MRTLIVIPTYDERENIAELIPALLRLEMEPEVLVVDDASPDGTAEEVRRWQERVPGRVHLIERPAKLGLGSAYCQGFQWALQREYEVVVQMDADFSHDPRDVPRLVAALANADVALGSRYVSGVNVVNWPMGRLLLSWLANRYTRWVTGMPIADATSGFKAFWARTLRRLRWDRIRSNGYAFQIEVTYRLWRLGCRIVEVPIVFVDRRSGFSKLNRGIVSEAAWMVWRLRLSSLLRDERRYYTNR